MTGDEIRAAFSTHPDHGATVRMAPEADHIAAMRAKDDRIAELERLLNAAERTRDTYQAANSNNLELQRKATSQCDKLRAENARLREALTPLAKAGELFAGIPARPDCYAVLYNPAAGPEYQITEQHVRAAWAALQSEVSHDRT